MAATITFYAGGYGFPINSLNGSGLGFFGSGGFGQSVSVGNYQDTTFITNGDGTSQGPQVNNVTYNHPQSGVVQGGTILNLTSMPNYQSTLNIRLTNDTAVRTQNAKLYIYDRTSLSNPASGVTTAVASIIHPSQSQVTGGSGSINWEFPAGTSYLDMSHCNNGVSFSPGASGLGINGGATSDTTHDFYISISASPNSIGSKTLYGLFFQTDYL